MVVTFLGPGNWWATVESYVLNSVSVVLHGTYVNEMLFSTPFTFGHVMVVTRSPRNNSMLKGV